MATLPALAALMLLRAAALSPRATRRAVFAAPAAAAVAGARPARAASKTTASGLYWEDVKVGQGDGPAKLGDARCAHH